MKLNFSLKSVMKNMSLVECQYISKGMLNPFGTVQAGAMIWLADVTASVLAISCQEIRKRSDLPLTLSL